MIKQVKKEHCSGKILDLDGNMIEENVSFNISPFAIKKIFNLINSQSLTQNDQEIQLYDLQINVNMQSFITNKHFKFILYLFCTEADKLDYLYELDLEKVEAKLDKIEYYDNERNIGIVNLIVYKLGNIKKLTEEEIKQILK